MKVNTAEWNKKEQEARLFSRLVGALSEQRRRWNLDLGSRDILPLSTRDQHTPVLIPLRYAYPSRLPPSEPSCACCTTAPPLASRLVTMPIAPRFLLLEPKAQPPFCLLQTHPGVQGLQYRLQDSSYLPFVIVCKHSVLATAEFGHCFRLFRHLGIAV